MAYALNTSAFNLTPAQADPILSDARNYSAVMQLGRQIPLAEAGTRVPVMNGQATANIVGESSMKPKYKPVLSDTHITKSKFALIAVASSEVARANPDGIISVVRNQISSAFARALDHLALYGGVSGQGYVDQTTSTVAFGTAGADNGGTYQDIVSGLDAQVQKEPSRKTTGYVFDTKTEPVLLSSVDMQGRPLWVDVQTGNEAIAVTPGRIIGRPSYMVAELTEDNDAGFAGDWSKVVWGVLNQPSFRTVLDGTYTDDNDQLRSTTENNEVLVIGEFEAAAACVDPEAFVKFTNPGGTEAGAQTASTLSAQTTSEKSSTKKS